MHDLLPVTRPECSTPGHGYMVLRQAHTPEQAFCGTWYRCERCMAGALLPSSELLAQLAEMGGED